MYRLSLIISEIYNKFLPLAEQNGIRLDLDLVDTDVVINELTDIKKDIEKTISDAIGRPTKGEITIQVTRQEIIITDTGTTLSRPVCTLLSSKYIDVSSRIGFGTKVRIKLSRDETKKLDA